MRKRCRVSVVTTTINIPRFLQTYLKNFRNFHVPPENVNFIIIGDKKSPDKEIKKFISKLNSEYDIFYFDVKQQKKWIKHTYENKERKLNFNSIQFC